MNNDESTTKIVELLCPICGRGYATAKARPTPTCGEPNCIREARARGLPFKPEPCKAQLKPKKPKKPKKDKPPKVNP